MAFTFFEIERVIKARNLDIQRLRKCAGRVAPHSALKALSFLRRAEYLQSLNDQRRGNAKQWVHPHQADLKLADSVFH